MDRIKPIDLERHDLQTKFRGYDRAQVDALLKRAADEMAALLAELQAKKAECDQMKAQIENYQAQESTIKETLMVASRAADETRTNAHKEADLIVKEAKNRADEITKETKASLAEIKWDIERLRLDKQRFLNVFRNLLESHLRELAEGTVGLAVIESAEMSGSEDAAQA